MRFRTTYFAGVLLFLLMGLPARAEVKVVIEHNLAADAEGFKFKTVPAPSKNDAASQAKITLVDGQRDPNGGELKVLHDGKVPLKPDHPGRNFFFGQGQDGGRLALDLGKAIDVKQVNTYSSHPGLRGPQVYKLYAAEGSEPGFDAQPKKEKNPAECGWKLVTSVDTRPASGEAGGQYGVSVFDSAGALGKYRYLLFDISPTEKDDNFGNTFYSEIDVVDAAELKPPEPTDPAPTVQLISKSPEAAPYQISIDYSEAPDLKDWVEKQLQPTLDKWYPILAASLPSEHFRLSTHVAIVITDDYNGVAATTGDHVVCSLDWYRKNYNGEGVGSVIHELVHVVQQYNRVRGGAPNPGWLVEGIADYYRWFKYEPVPTGTRPRNPDKAKYTDSYRTTAGFLNFVSEKHDKELVPKLNAAMRQGKYLPDLWKEITGKTPEELWEEYVSTLR